MKSAKGSASFEAEEGGGGGGREEGREEGGCGVGTMSIRRFLSGIDTKDDWRKRVKKIEMYKFNILNEREVRTTAKRKKWEDMSERNNLPVSSSSLLLLSLSLSHTHTRTHLPCIHLLAHYHTG